MMKRFSVLFVFSVILLAGCAEATPAATPMPTTGQVKGVLISNATGEPLTTGTVNLIPIEVSDDGAIVYKTELLRETMSMELSEGAFLFEEVEPRSYVITLNSGSGMPLNLKDDQGHELILQIEAGDVMDLGEVPVK